MRHGFVITGAAVSVIQTVASPVASGALVGHLAALTWWEQASAAVMLFPVHAIIVALAGFASWHVLAAERRSGHPPALVDAAAGPLVMALFFGVSYGLAVGGLDLIGPTVIGVGTSTAGFLLSARSGAARDQPLAVIPESTPADPNAPAFPVPVRWRRALRRYLFLTAALVVVIAMTALVMTGGRPFVEPSESGAETREAAAEVAKGLAFAGALVNVFVVTLVRFVHRITWKRAWARSAIAFGVLLAVMLFAYLHLWVAFAPFVPLTLLVIGLAFVASALALRAEHVTARKKSALPDEGTHSPMSCDLPEGP